MEHEKVGTADGGSEDTGVGVKTAANVAVGAVEGQVLLSTTVIGLDKKIDLKISIQKKLYTNTIIKKKCLFQK